MDYYGNYNYNYRGQGGGGGYVRKPPTYEENPNHANFCKVFCGGLSLDTTEDTLKEHFQTYGDIKDVVVMKDANTKRSRGFGFVTFKESTTVDDVQANRPHKLDDKEIETRRATPKHLQDGYSDPGSKTTKLFLGGVKDEMTEEAIKEVFSEHGQVEEVHVVKDKNTGKGKGFAFITFGDTDNVDKCHLIQTFTIAGKTAHAKKAEDRSQGGGGRGGGGRGGRGGGRGGYSGGGGGGGDYGYGGYGGGGGYDGYSGYDDYSGGYGQGYQSHVGGGAMKQGYGGDQGGYGGGYAGYNDGYGSGYGGSGGYGGSRGGRGGYTPY